MANPLLSYVVRVDGGGTIVGFGLGGYKGSSLWCSMFVRFPSLSDYLYPCNGGGQA